MYVSIASIFLTAYFLLGRQSWTCIGKSIRLMCPNDAWHGLWIVVL